MTSLSYSCTDTLSPSPSTSPTRRYYRYVSSPRRRPPPPSVAHALFLLCAGHVAHGKSQTVKAISGVHTVRFKNELERNITIKLGYANAKVRLLPLPGSYSSMRTITDVPPPAADLQVREPEL